MDKKTKEEVKNITKAVDIFNTLTKGTRTYISQEDSQYAYRTAIKYLNKEKGKLCNTKNNSEKFIHLKDIYVTLKQYVGTYESELKEEESRPATTEYASEFQRERKEFLKYTIADCKKKVKVLEEILNEMENKLDE